MVEIDRNILEEFITRYGVTLVTRWCQSGEKAYHKRKQSAKTRSQAVSDRRLNSILRDLTGDEIDVLKAKVEGSG